MRPSPGAILLAAAALVAPAALALCALPPAEPADLVFVSGPEPETLDPAVAARVVDLRIVSALFEPLVALDPGTLSWRLAAAESWSADARGSTFTLAPGLRFSNGDPIEASDFVRSWRRAADPATGAPMQAEARVVAEGARSLDARTIRIEPAMPRPDLTALLSLPTFAPVHATAVATFGERWTRPENMVSSGPFRLAAWEPGRRIRLTRNPFWHGAANVSLGSIEAMATGGGSGEAIGAFRAYETGAADLSFSLPSRAVAALRAEGRGDLHERPGAGTYFLRFNCTRGALGSEDVRLALSTEIERESICRDVLRGGDEPAYSLVPTAFRARPRPGGDRDAPAIRVPPGESELRAGRDSVSPDELRDRLDQVARRREVARRLLDGVTLEYLYPASDDAAATVGEVLQETWRQRFGLTLRLRPSEPKTAFAAVKRLEYDIAWGSWIADYPDAGSVLAIFRSGSGNNRTGWSSARFDGLLDGSVPLDPRETHDGRTRLDVAERELLLAAPLAPLFRTRAAALVRPGLEGADALPFAHTMPWASLRWVGGKRP